MTPGYSECECVNKIGPETVCLAPCDKPGVMCLAPGAWHHATSLALSAWQHKHGTACLAHYLAQDESPVPENGAARCQGEMRSPGAFSVHGAARRRGDDNKPVGKDGVETIFGGGWDVDSERSSKHELGERYQAYPEKKMNNKNQLWKVVFQWFCVKRHTLQITIICSKKCWMPAY